MSNGDLKTQNKYTLSINFVLKKLKLRNMFLKLQNHKIYKIIYNVGNLNFNIFLFWIMHAVI